jgi:hypothetical protein
MNPEETPEPDCPEEAPTAPGFAPAASPAPPPPPDQPIFSRIQVMRNNRNQRLILMCQLQTRMTEKDKERCSLLVHAMYRAFADNENRILDMMDHQVRAEFAKLESKFQAKPRIAQ